MMLKLIFFLPLLLLFSEAQVESLNSNGSIGLQTPVINVNVDKEFISHTDLTLERDKGKSAFLLHEEAELPERLTISTTLLSLPIMPDSDHSDLAFDIYELGTGPAVENGFYYDVDFGDYNFSDKEFKNVEQKMLELVDRLFKKSGVSGTQQTEPVVFMPIINTDK